MKVTTNILEAWEKGFKFPVMDEINNSQDMDLVFKFIGFDTKKLDCNSDIAVLNEMFHIILELSDGNIDEYEFASNYSEIFNRNSQYISMKLGKYSFDIDECFFTDITMDTIANFLIQACEDFVGTAIEYDDYSEYYGDSLKLDNGEVVIALFNKKANQEQVKQDKQNSRSNCLVYNIARCPSKQLTEQEVKAIDNITARGKEVTDFILYNGYVSTWNNERFFMLYDRKHESEKSLLSFF